ncbi:MAG TPA: hypothetical protein VGB70_12695 [Allosphingosinicella sp.]|jgi:hypothetical protein
MIFEPGKTYSDGRSRRFVLAVEGGIIRYCFPLSRWRTFAEPVADFQAWFGTGGEDGPVPLWPADAIAAQQAGGEAGA